MSRICLRLLPLLLLVLLHPNYGVAQQRDPGPNLNLGDAVVTGFSGTILPAPRPANKSPVDLTFIDPNGPSARVARLAQPGFVWDGRLFAAPKTFDVLAKDVGQVFGVALDDANPPNIYLGATSLFGLNLVSRDRSGVPQRRKKGGPGAGWMAAQFGLDLQGGPGAIYKVDGRTGAVSLFANVTLDGVPNPATGLGNLAYDAAHKQLFVSDLYSGMIHRFDLDGHELGRFDHGVTALAAAKLPTVAFDPKNRPNIASPSFDTENPDTWGFAPAARRVFALAVHDGRLYYSVLSGPKIWSVGIKQDGSFADDPRWELDVPSQAGPLAVTDIAFSQKGAMILAERARIRASYDFSAFTHPGQPRVLRFWLKGPNDPPSPSRWKLVPDEYAVGLPVDYRNTNGGVALGYGYDDKGVLSTGACESALWTTGQDLRNNPALQPGDPLLVNGLQGNPADMVRPANAPPKVSYFVDYDDKFDDPRATGHMGSVRVYTTPCAPSAAVAPVAEAAPPAPPAGCVGPDCENFCTPTCICPPGTELRGKECVKRDCPDGQVYNAATNSCSCPRGMVWRDGKCVRGEILAEKCAPPMIPGPTPNSCVCPSDMALINGKCEPVRCRPPFVNGPNGTCICPQGSVQQGEKCVPQVCPPPLVPGPCKCPDGTMLKDGRCVKGTPIDLGVEKTGDTSPPVDVPWYGFHVTVTNHGPGSTAPGTITVTEVVPNGMTFTSVSGSNWTCVPTSGGPGTQITCTYNLATNAGDVLPVINIVAHADGKGPYPPFTNCAVVGPKPGSGYIDTDPSNDKFCVTVTKPPGTLVVNKKVDPDPRGLGASLTFLMTVTCTNPAGTYTVTVTGNSSSVPLTLPAGSQCTVTETLPTLPAGCTWLTPNFSPATVTITGLLTQENVINGYRCRDVCPPPMVMNAAGICVCPSPMVAGATPNTCVCPQGTTLVDGNCVPTDTCPAPQVMIPGVGCRCPPPMVPGPTPNTCVCPQNTTLVDGKCVPTDTCTAPLVMIPGVGCRCPDGEVQVGKECKKPISCESPLVPNATNTGCTCRHGLVLRRGKCVEPEKPKREHTCKRGFVWNGEACVRREKRRQDENVPERPQIRIPFPGGLSPGGPSPGGPRSPGAR